MDNLISQFGFWVALLFTFASFLVVILVLLAVVSRHLTGWNAGGFKRLMSESLVDIIEELDGDTRWLACYLRECVVDDEIPTGEGARLYIMRAQQSPEDVLRGAIRYESAFGLLPGGGERREL